MLRIHHYESKHQSMSVLFRNKQTGAVLVGVKGSPEKMHAYSRVKVGSFE